MDGRGCYVCTKPLTTNSGIRLKSTIQHTNVTVAEVLSTHMGIPVSDRDDGFLLYVCALCHDRVSQMYSLEKKAADARASLRRILPKVECLFPKEGVDWPLPRHSELLRDGLLLYYDHNQYLHDAYITTAGRRVLSAHRIVLASHSPVLYNIFSVVPEVKRLLLEEFAYKDVKTVIDAMYTGMLRLSTGNIPYVKAIVRKLEIPSMMTLCEQFEQGSAEMLPQAVFGHNIHDETSRVDMTPAPIEIVPTSLEDPPVSVHPPVSVSAYPGTLHIKAEAEDPCEMEISHNIPEPAETAASPMAAPIGSPVARIKEEDDRSKNVNTPNLLSQMDASEYLLNSSCSPNHTRMTSPTRAQSPELLNIRSASQEEQQYRCKMCGKRFPFFSNLKLHSRKHNDGRNLVNQRCPRRTKCDKFKRGQGYRCAVCPQVFRLRTTALWHLRTGHFAKAQCKQCGLSFMSYCHLQDHRYHKHKARMKLATNCACLQCCQVFRHQSNADKHTPCTVNLDWPARIQLSASSRVSTVVVGSHFVCRHCKQKFRHPRLLKRHMDLCLLWNCKKIKMEECSEPKAPLTAAGENSDMAVTPKSAHQLHDLKPHWEAELFEQKILGDDSPYQLLRTMIYMVDTYFSQLKEKTMIYREQIIIASDEQGTFVRFREARLAHMAVLKFGNLSNVKLHENKNKPQHCFVRLVGNYLSRCPKLHDFLSPFFLVAKKEFSPCYWYMQRKQGTCTIHKMLKEVYKEKQLLAEAAATLQAASVETSEGQYIEIAPVNGASVEQADNTNQSADSVMHGAKSKPLSTEVTASSKCTQVGKFIFYSPEISYRNLNNWLKKDKSQCESDLRVVNKLKLINGGKIDALAPCQLYFVLKYLLQGKVFGTFGSYSRIMRHTPALMQAIEYVIEQYLLNGKSKGYIFEQANIQAMLVPKIEKWYPSPTLPPLLILAEQGILDDKEPEVLLQSVLFLMIATFQLTQAELHTLTRSMVVIDEDAQGRYLCLCKDMSASLNHAYVHEYPEGEVKGLTGRLFRNDTALFIDTPLRIYAKPETPQICLVHYMSVYLAKSLPLEKSLFSQPSRAQVASQYWYKQQAVGRNWIRRAVEKVLSAVGVEDHNSRDHTLDLIHSQAIEYGHPRLEPCSKCEHYTQKT